MHYSLSSGIREQEEIEGVVVMVCESGVHRLHQELSPARDLVRSKIRAVDECVATVISTLTKVNFSFCTHNANHP